MAKMPAVRGDGMRGLAVFISDIRNCKSKEAEIKRINKELANIRNKFKVICVKKFCFVKNTVFLKKNYVIGRSSGVSFRPERISGKNSSRIFGVTLKGIDHKCF